MMIIPLAQTPPLPFVTNVLSSHMVLQRDKPNTFWGWTKPGETVTVTLDGRSASGVAGPDGKWIAKLTPPRVGGPYTVQIDGSQHVTLDDVLVGDVWLCGGQSNMEFGLTLANGGPEAVSAANDPQIRIFLAPKATAFKPQPLNGGTWKVATPETVAQDGWGGFSAVGYFFGKKIHDEIHVPIGLVGDYWGGTNAESWMSASAAHTLGDFDKQLSSVDAFLANGSKAYEERVADWYVTNDPGSKPGQEWFRPAEGGNWQTVDILKGFEQIGMGNSDGTAWFRRTIDLTAAQAAGEATLTLGAIDDADTTWVNGELLGSHTVWNEPRVYKISPGTLHEGANMIAVRVLDTGAQGGFSGPEDALALTLGDGTKIPLSGDWQARAGVDFNRATAYPMDMNNNPNVPTVLSNGMIEPIVPLALKGAIWYQGENNAGRAYQYRKVLPAMIEDWRKRFAQGDFPFYIVSLANFMPHRDTPGDDAWAELREAQARTAAGVKNSGIALAIDVGDAGDIHPKDKKTVGERLALIALARDYGKKVAYEGPTYKAMKVEGSSIRLTFDHAAGLTTHGTVPGEFAICGVDHQWHWASAKIDGQTIVVSSPEVPKPVAVRYAWQSNPVANVYNGAGLPMVPFRTDQYPGVTFDNR